MGNDIKSWSKNYFSNIPKVIFIVMLLLTCVTVTIFDIRKEVVVVVDGKSTTIVTLRSNLSTILSSNNIEVGEKDKSSINLDDQVKDGDTIFIKRAIKVNLEVDGKQLEIYSAENTIDDMLEAESIEMNELDKISPDVSEELIDDMDIQITRIAKKTIEIKEALAYSKHVKNSDDLMIGQKKVVQEGQLGEKVITTEITYEDGNVIEEKVLNEEVVKKPIDEVIAMGTLGVLRPSRGGEYYYGNTIQVKATAYTADVGPNGKPDDPYLGKTAIGTMAKRNPNGYSTIAVDPRVIPLGTKVYVEGYGLAIAEDVGGAIKGNRIDVFMNTYPQTTQWGVRYVNVYILKDR